MGRIQRQGQPIPVHTAHHLVPLTSLFGVDGNHLCTWEQADGLVSAAGGRSLSLQSRLQQPPKEQQPSQVLAPPSPLPSSVSPTTALPQPKAHRCPTSRAANYSALSLEAATSRSATTAGTPRGTSLGRWQGAGKFDWLWVHYQCLLLDN